MTPTGTAEFDDSDCQRAASMAAHFARGDIDGVTFAIADALDHGRVVGTFTAMLAVFANVVPDFQTEESADGLERMAQTFAHRAAGGHR